MERITITDDHLKLLSRMYVDWSDTEFGAPRIDPKRPYGNSDVYSDIGEILEIEPIKTHQGEEVFTAEQGADMARIHRELAMVLQICLRNQSLECGSWVRDEPYHAWEKATT